VSIRTPFHRPKTTQLLLMPATTVQALRGLLLASQLAVAIIICTWIFGYLGGVSLRPVKAGFAAGVNDTNRCKEPRVAWRVDSTTSYACTVDTGSALQAVQLASLADEPGVGWAFR
jgi:hypothetical protein